MPLPTPVGWLFDVLGVKDFFDSVGTLYPRRQQMRLLGVNVADNATLGTTDVTFPGDVVRGDLTAGVHIYDPDTTAHVWNDSTAVASGTIWRIGTTAIRKTIKFSSRHFLHGITIEDPTGNVLGSLLFTTGNVYSMEIYFDGSQYRIVDQRFAQ